MVPGSCTSLVCVSCFVVLRTWMALFPLALLIWGLRFTLQSKLLDENVCACEIALHSGWASARPPCPPPPARGRPGSGSLLSGATY